MTRKIRMPKARRADPQTSWDAAKSVDPNELARAQRDIYVIIKARGPISDEEIYSLYCQNDLAPISQSGARTRRAELVAMGLVRDSGKRGVTASGRRTIKWELDNGSEDVLRERDHREDQDAWRERLGGVRAIRRGGGHPDRGES